jgi:hypothetical protein
MEKSDNYTTYGHDLYSDGEFRSDYRVDLTGASESLSLRNGKTIKLWTSLHGDQQIKADDRLTVVGLNTLPLRSVTPTPKPLELPKPKPSTTPTWPDKNDVTLTCNGRLGVFKNSNKQFIAVAAIQAPVMVRWIFEKDGKVSGTLDIQVMPGQAETATAQIGGSVGFDCP